MFGLAIRKGFNGAFYVTRYGHNFWASGYAAEQSAVNALHIARGLCEGQPLAGLLGAREDVKRRALKEWRALRARACDSRPSGPQFVAGPQGELFVSAQLDT